MKAWLEINKEKNRVFLFAKLQSGIKSGRAVKRGFEASDGIKSTGAHQGEVARRRQGSHDHTGEQPETGRVLFSRPARQVCRVNFLMAESIIDI